MMSGNGCRQGMTYQLLRWRNFRVGVHSCLVHHAASRRATFLEEPVGHVLAAGGG